MQWCQEGLEVECSSTLDVFLVLWQFKGQLVHRCIMRLMLIMQFLDQHSYIFFSYIVEANIIYAIFWTRIF